MVFKSLCNEEWKSQAPCGLGLTDGAQVSPCWAPGSSPPPSHLTSHSDARCGPVSMSHRWDGHLCPGNKCGQP